MLVVAVEPTVAIACKRGVMSDHVAFAVMEYNGYLSSGVKGYWDMPSRNK
jgi:hypothetical protein